MSKSVSSVSRESYDALARINKIQEDEIQKLRTEISDLTKKMELLKKFSLLDALLK